MVKHRKEKQVIYIKTVTDGMIQEMKRLRERGLLQTEIAERLGVSQRTVSYYIGKKNVRSPHKNAGLAEFKDWSPEESMVGSVGLFIKGWSKVAFWIGAAVFIWIVLSLK